MLKFTYRNNSSIAGLDSVLIQDKVQVVRIDAVHVQHIRVTEEGLKFIELTECSFIFLLIVICKNNYQRESILGGGRNVK